MVFHIRDLLYYTTAQIAVTNKAIATVILELVVKVTKNENKHLQHHAICLIDDLELLQFLYLMEYNMTSIAPVIRSLKQTHTISEQFNNLSPIG